jgi:hypothetical protein
MIVNYRNISRLISSENKFAIGYSRECCTDLYGFPKAFPGDFPAVFAGPLLDQHRVNNVKR